jgi:hypothetical protein
MIMNSKLKMREVTDSDINELISLHNAHYLDNRTTEQWTWEYKGNYPDFFVFTVIEDNGEIVGTQGMIPIYINIKGRRYLSGKRENGLLLDKYRGGALYQDLLEFAHSLCREKNMFVTWGFSDAVRVRRPGTAIYANCMDESILVLNLRNALNQIVRPERTTGKNILMSIFAIFCYSYSLIVSSLVRFRYSFWRNSTGTKYSIEHRLRSIDDLNKLYERLREIYPDLIYIDQDDKYITWRIYSNPNIRYETYFIYEDNLLRGNCYVGEKDNRVASIADFTFESTEAAAFLLRSLISKWRKERIGYVYFFGNAKNPLAVTVFNLLKRFGSLRRRNEDAFVLKNMSYNDEGHLHDIKNWYLGGLWREGYTI